MCDDGTGSRGEVDQGQEAVQCLVKARCQENGVCSPWSVRCVARPGRNARLFFALSQFVETQRTAV